MRQGESTSEGKWMGNPVGGVKAPEPIILPNPSKRFIRTASRLVELAPGHPMVPWLRFMAKLSQAQHVAATSLAPSVPAEGGWSIKLLRRACRHLAADGHRRDPAWREGLAILLDNFDSGDLAAGSAGYRRPIATPPRRECTRGFGRQFSARRRFQRRRGRHAYL